MKLDRSHATETDISTEDGYLLKNEWPLYVFDALLMVLVLTVSLSVSTQLRSTFQGLLESESHILERLDA